MPSSVERTLVMTELGSFFFSYFPLLLARPRFRIERVLVSAASADRLGALLAAPRRRRFRTALRHVVRSRSLDPARCLRYLRRHRDRVDVFEPSSFTPVPTDYLCSLGFLRRIPAAQIAVSRTSSNVHWSLLPRYAGCHPEYWALRHGEEASGVTIHRIAEGYDDGDVLLQHRLRLDPRETRDELRRRLRRVSRTEFARYLDHKERFDRLARPQDPAARSFFGVPAAAEHRLVPGDDPEAIRRKFRASGVGRCFVATPDGERAVVGVEGVRETGGEPIRLGDVTVYARAA